MYVCVHARSLMRPASAGAFGRADPAHKLAHSLAELCLHSHMFGECVCAVTIFYIALAFALASTSRYSPFDVFITFRISCLVKSLAERLVECLSSSSSLLSEYRYTHWYTNRTDTQTTSCKTSL